MAYIPWYDRLKPATLGERFGLNEISTARNTLSPTNSHTIDRIDMKPGGLVEPGVTHYGVKTGDTSRPQNRPTPMSKELATWYEKNKGTLLKDADGNFKPVRTWEDLEVSERTSVKSQFEKRNNPFYKNLRNLDILKDFLQKQKDAGRTVFKKTLPEIAKEAGLTLKGHQVRNIINNYFPDTFNYRGLNLDQAPGVLKRVKELAKTNTANEITAMLFDEGLTVSKTDTSIRQLMKDNKIPMKIATQDIDDLVKTYVKNNPKINDVNQIAKNLNVDPVTVRLAADRLNIKNLTSLQTGILKEIKALDDIVKNSIDIINDPNMTTPAKNRILQEHYLKATGKKFANLSTSELGNRLSRLAKLYAGEGRIHAFKNIKSPLNYLDLSNPLQRNIIEMVSQAKRINNFDMGQMLGLPKNQLKLISDTTALMKAFDFSVAGDHTDIKSMMKDFPNYKKNFLKIEYIKSNLNLYKRKYDLEINALRKKAQQATKNRDFVNAKKFLDDAKIIQENFATNTGYRIGAFDIKNNRVVLNPKTERLIDLKNPLNTVLQTAIRNFATTSSPETGKILAAKKEIFSSLDKKLSNIKTGVEERIEIFKKIQGTNAAKQSQYLKALSKIPGKYGQAAKAIILGTAGAATIATLASAGTTLEKGITTKEMKERKANAKTTLGEYAAGAAATGTGVAITKYGAWNVAKALGRWGLLYPMAASAVPFWQVTGAGIETVKAALEKRFPDYKLDDWQTWMRGAFWDWGIKTFGLDKMSAAFGGTFKTLSKMDKARVIRNVAARGLLSPKAVKFVSKKIAWPVTAGLVYQDLEKWAKKNVRKTPLTELELKDIQKRKDALPTMISITEQAYKRSKQEGITYEDALKKIKQELADKETPLDIPGIEFKDKDDLATGGIASLLK